MRPPTSPEGRDLAVACCQLAPTIGDPEKNLAQTRPAIEQAAQSGARLVVLPELANSGYVFRSEDEARDLSESVAGPTVTAWRGVAAKYDIVVVGGICEAGPDGSLYNSAVLIAGDGEPLVYRKRHLWANENAVFSPGKASPPVIATPVGMVGVAVCYDIEFPETCRSLALAGAEIICVPMNWPRSSREADEPSAAVTITMANARRNRVVLAVCDRCGEERGEAFEGASVIVDARGTPLAGPVADGTEQTLLTVCRLEGVRRPVV